MVGTALAGTFESPGDVKVDHTGSIYKVNYGMASARAVAAMLPPVCSRAPAIH